MFLDTVSHYIDQTSKKDTQERRLKLKEHLLSLLL